MDGTDELNSQQVELEISSSSPDQHSSDPLKTNVANETSNVQQLTLASANVETAKERNKHN